MSTKSRKIIFHILPDLEFMSREEFGIIYALNIILPYFCKEHRGRVVSVDGILIWFPVIFVAVLTSG